MPRTIVIRIDMSCRPGTTRRASAPAIRPMTMMLTMSPNMGFPFGHNAPATTADAVALEWRPARALRAISACPRHTAEPTGLGEDGDQLSCDQDLLKHP